MWIYVMQVIAWVFCGLLIGVAVSVGNAEPIPPAVICFIAGIVLRMIEADEVKLWWKGRKQK